MGTLLAACLLCSARRASPDNIVVTMVSVPLCSIAPGVGCWGTTMWSIGNIPQMYLLIYVVPTSTFTSSGRSRTKFKPSGLPFVRVGLHTEFQSPFFAAYLNFGDWRRLMRHFHWGFKYFSLIKIYPASLSTRNVSDAKPSFKAHSKSNLICRFC